MKRILLATVATLPVLVVGINPASSQDIKRQGSAGISQSQESARSHGEGVPGKAEGAVKMNEGSGARMNQSSNAQGRSEQVKSEPGRTEGRAVPGHEGRAVPGHEGRAVPGHEGSAVAAGQDQEKDRAQSAIQSESRKAEPKQTQTSAKERSGQAGSEKAKQEPSAATKSQVRESQNKAKADEKLTKSPQNESARTTGQATRTNQDNDRVPQGSDRVQQNARAQNGQTQQRGGEAGGRVTLNGEQRTRIEKTVLSGRDVPRVDRVDFTVDVGRVVPREVRFARVPETLVQINSEWRDDEYFVVRDEIVIVDRSRRVVAVVPLGSSSATYETRSRSAVDTGDVDIRRVQEVLIEKGYYHGPVDGELGPETRQALISFQEHEGIEVRGVIDERTYAALGIRVGSGRSEGRAEGSTEERIQGRSEGRTEGRTEGRPLQSEVKGRLSEKPGQSELKRDHSSISGEARGGSIPSELASREHPGRERKSQWRTRDRQGRAE